MTPEQLQQKVEELRDTVIEAFYPDGSLTDTFKEEAAMTFLITLRNECLEEAAKQFEIRGQKNLQSASLVRSLKTQTEDNGNAI